MRDLLAFTAILALVICVPSWWKRHRLMRAAFWPVAQGHIELIEESRDDTSFLRVTLAYTYKVHDERYVGRESFRFIRDEEASLFEAGCRGRSVLVHYRPDKPQVSVLRRQDMV